MPENNTKQTEGNEASRNATSGDQFNKRSQQPLQENKENKNSRSTNQDDTTLSQSTNDLNSDNMNAAGTDRAGTADRKSFGDTELNKGLESQAKDEESKQD